MLTPSPDTPASSASLRPQALAWLQISSPHDKARAVRAALCAEWLIEPDCVLSEPAGVPGRPLRPTLVQPAALKHRAVGTPEGHASLIHALAHIEANAINLALDMVWRFASLPESFYRDWLIVAQEEALHFDLLQAHLGTLGYQYGDFPAHDGLWDMAERTRHDVLARLALVPRTLEARGLDATPPIRKKLVSIGDRRGDEILDIILRDEIGHVTTGNHWYRQLCTQRGLDPLLTYASLAEAHRAPTLKGPYNWDARRAAGFTEDELSALCGTPAP